MLSNSELEEKANRYREKIANFTDIWNEIPDERRCKIYGSLGRRTRALGGYTVLVGDIVGALENFEEASNWYHKGVERCPGHINQVNRHYWALQMAILAKNDTARAEAMGLTVETPDVEYLADYAASLSGLLSGEDEDVEQVAAALTDTEQSVSEVP